MRVTLLVTHNYGPDCYSYLLMWSSEPFFFRCTCMYSFFLCPCSAQAPADEDVRCTGDENAPTYPNPVRNRMDTCNYVQLLPVLAIALGTTLSLRVYSCRLNWQVCRYATEYPVTPSSFDVTSIGSILLLMIAKHLRSMSISNEFMEINLRQDNFFTQYTNQDFNPNTYNYTVKCRYGCIPAVSTFGGIIHSPKQKLQLLCQCKSISACTKYVN